MSEVQVEISGGIATITFNRPDSLNAITPDGSFQFFQVHNTNLTSDWNAGYNAFAEALRDIDKRDDVKLTIWQGIFMTFAMCL